jgi:hypothetical protein
VRTIFPSGIHAGTNCFIMGALLAFLAYGRLIAQPTLTTFGIVSEYRTLKNARGVIVGDFNGDGTDDIASYDGVSVFIHFQGNDALSWRTTSFTLDHVFSRIVSARFNGDRSSDLVTLIDDPAEIRVYLAGRGGTFRPRWQTLLPEPFDTLTVADINSDNKMDILLYGKKHLGITAFLGNGDGTFKKPKVLFPEASFGIVSVADVNGDGLNDLIAVDWIKNEVLYYPAFGKMKFSDPAVITLAGEPSSVDEVSMDGDPFTDLVIGFAEQGKVQTFTGDGFGKFDQLQTVTLPISTAQIILRDVNGDGRADLMALGRTTATVTVLLNGARGLSAEPVILEAGADPLDIVTFTHAGMRSPDLCVLDRTPSRLRVFYNALVKPPEGMTLEYCTGIRPQGVIASDIDHDGWNDIIVANSGSSSLGMFFSQDSGRIAGGWTVPLPIEPVSLRSIAQDDSTAVIISAGAHGELAVTDINTRTYGHSTSMLPASFRSEIVSVSAPDGNLRIIAILQSAPGERPAMTEYEEVSASRFTEQNIPGPDGNRLIEAIPLPEKNQATRRLAVMTYDDHHKRAAVCELWQQDVVHGTPVKVRPLFSVPAIESSKVFLWGGHINSDRATDIIVSADDTLYAFLARGDTAFRRPVRCLSRAVSVTSTDQLQIADLNDDGRGDLIISNALTKTIEVYWGRGDGTFSSVKRLISSQGVGGFALSDIDNDGIPELLLTDESAGLLKVIHMGR